MTTPVATPAERDAVVRFQPAGTGPHVESTFLKANLPGGRALWLKLTFLRQTFGRRATVVEAWAMAFNLASPEPGDRPKHVAVKQTWPAGEARIERDAFFVETPGVRWAWGSTRGAVEDATSGARVAWDLTFPTEPEGLRHMPADWMYEGRVPKTKATSPVVDTRVKGTVTVEGHTTELREAPGMLGHNWGTQQAETWAWAHGNAWVDAAGEPLDGVVFEGVSSKVKFGPLTSPLLTIVHARFPGERITMNGWLDLVRTRSRFDGLAWEVRAQRGDRRITAHLQAPVDRFVGVNYHDPDGRIAHCLNTKIADGSLTVEGRGEGGRWRPLVQARSDRSAALEIGDRDGTRGVPLVIF